MPLPVLPTHMHPQEPPDRAGACLHSHDIEDDGEAGSDEHDGGVDLVVAGDDAQHGQVDEHRRDDPDHQHRHQRPHHL